ncbi:hypothetical protein GH811_12165 [Acetobacterium malicum]|uniref:Uncharacterized protein n=1 Tax=Acetobacterium malicum TaxID=52692 RepID=A0ABR6YYX9_9FIRM|nr:hypothetical protein [Acetobacterium malicum]MBC3900373.1 hypothetical protein [Acetobacterium malicum]
MIDQQSYKKTYKPLILWMILFIAVCTLIPMLINQIFEQLFQITWGEGGEVRVILMFMVISIDGLMWMIYAGEYVYWINGGPSFEEAKAAGSEKRKAYAGAHLRVFLKMTLVCCVYIVISSFFRLPMLIDIVVIASAIVAAAIKTIPIRFN